MQKENWEIILWVNNNNNNIFDMKVNESTFRIEINSH